MRKWTTCGAFGALLIGIVACAPAPDPATQVEEALERSQIEGVSAEWNESAQTVHLTGEVATDADRSLAEDVAEGALGGRAQVMNELTVQASETDLADDFDDTIKASIENAIDNDETLRERNINVTANNGVVTITGEVESQEEKDRVTELVNQVPGISEVANSLAVVGAPAPEPTE